MAIILDDHNVRFLTPPISPVSNLSAITLVPMMPVTAMVTMDRRNT